MNKKPLTIYILSLILAGIVLKPAFLSAQDTSYRLQEIYELSIKNYPDLSAKKESIQALSVEKQLVNALQLPQVHLQLQNTFGTFHGSTGSVFSLPGIFNVNSGLVANSDRKAISTSFGSVVADWTIFSFGKIQKQKLATQFKIEEAEKELTATELNLKSRITYIFLKQLALQSKYKWAEENALRVKQILEIARSYTRAGLKPGADSSLAVSSYLKIQADLAKWKGALIANEKEMEEFLQFPFSIDMQSKLAFFKKRPSLELKDTTFISHPYLNVLESRIAYYDALEESFSRAALPSASLLGGLSMRASGVEEGRTTQDWASSFQDPQNNYLIGIGIKWNITGAYNSKLKQKQLKHQSRSVGADYNQRKLQLKTALSATKNQMMQDFLRIDATAQSMENARIAYELYNNRYESGLLGLTELLQIQRILQDSELAHIEAYEELWDRTRLYAEYAGDFSNLFSLF